MNFKDNTCTRCHKI